MIIVGEQDLKLAQQAAIDMHRLEQSSKFVTLLGAGHCANADTPNEFNKVVEQFVRFDT